MDDPSEENIENNWVIVNSIDVAEEALEVDSLITDTKLLEVATKDSNDTSEREFINNQDNESDLESDGISIISESSHLHETTTDDENLQNEVGKQEFVKEDFSNSSPDLKPDWMFVDSCANSSIVENTKQFYLNCLQEPIHELSENELGSVQSDRDSDGISIISECVSSLESFKGSSQICQNTITTELSENEKLEYMNKVPNFIRKYFNGLLIGTILLASSSIFLGHYFNFVDTFDNDSYIYNDYFINEVQDLSDNILEIKDKYDVPTALAYCSEQHKSDNIFMEQNVKKCLRKIENRIKKRKENILKKEQMQKLEKYLRIKEKYLKEKEKFLIKREFEILKAEFIIECDQLKISQNYPSDRVNSEDIYADGERRWSIKDKKFDNSQILHKKRILDDNIKKNFNDKIKKYSMGSKKDNSKIHLNKYKDKKKCLYKNVQHYGKEKPDNLQSREQSKGYCKLKDNRRKYFKSKTGNCNDMRNNESDKYSCQGNRNEKYKNKKNKISSNDSLNYILVENKNYTANGYWVGKLYKARDELRNKHNSGDWYFDRAFYRKRKRDKAKWYFDWMMNREILRYKRTFHI